MRVEFQGPSKFTVEMDQNELLDFLSVLDKAVFGTSQIKGFAYESVEELRNCIYEAAHSVEELPVGIADMFLQTTRSQVRG